MNCDTVVDNNFLIKFVNDWKIDNNSNDNEYCSDSTYPLIDYLKLIKNKNKPLSNFCEKCVSVTDGNITSPFLNLKNEPMYYYIPDINAGGESTGQKNKLVKIPVTEKHVSGISEVRTTKEGDLNILYIKAENCNGLPLPVYTGIKNPGKSYVRVSEIGNIPKIVLSMCPDCKTDRFVFHRS